MTRPPAPDPGRLDPAHRPIIPSFRDLWTAAPDYQPDDELLPAVDIAIALGAPLLVTGEPGTGKTQVAYYLAWRFGVPQERLHRLDVRSTTTAEDLVARLDTVAYFHAAHIVRGDASVHEQGPAIDPRAHYVKGPLYKAWTDHDGPSIVLIDEVDKASRDFPNDLLNTLDQHSHRVPETGDVVCPPADRPPPLVVITSNIERQLPEPFLRRCIYHHIRFDEGRLRRAIQAHGRHLAVTSALIDAAVDRFLGLRNTEAATLRKLPSTGELLMWLVALQRRSKPVEPDWLRGCANHELPAISTLVKDDHDLRALRGLVD